MNKSDSLKAIGKALMTFHKEMGVVFKEEENPFFKSAYADLPAILKAIKEPLQKAGLAFTQFPTGENEMTTLLIHPESGEFLEDSFKMTPSKNDPQGQGSVITYQRRYALGAVLGLNIDIDDDGNAGSDNNANKKAPAKGKKTVAPAGELTPAQKFERAKKMLNASTDAKVLLDYADKLADSKFTVEQKSELNKIIESRVDVLEFDKGGKK